MSKKATLAAALVTILAFTILVTLVVVFVGDDPSIVGLAVSDVKADVKVSKDLADRINTEGEVNVIIILKDTDKSKIKIKQKQDAILSKLDYEDAKHNKKFGIASNKSKEFRLEHKYGNVNALSGNITKAGLKKLQKDPNVEKIVPVRQVSISLTSSIPLINVNDARGIIVNATNITGRGQSICVIDTGINYTHESFGGCTLSQVSQHTCKQVIAGYDFVNDDIDPMDDNDHGTHVSGIAAANGTVVGVAPGARIVAMKALNAAGSGNDGNIIAAIDWCINNATLLNISVISMSLGDQENYTQSTCPTSMDSSMSAAVDARLTVVVASGNEGKNNGISYPACSPFSISVGASDDSDSMASFTNTFSNLDIVAPGVTIVSTDNGGTTRSDSGTSMATPHAAGVAAMIYQYEKLRNNQNATHDKIKKLFKGSSTLVSDSGLSFPRIDALQAINDILTLNATDNSATANEVKIGFKTATNLENLSEAFTLRHNFIEMNSSKYVLYNKTANVTFFNITFANTPVILKNGKVCTECSVLSYSAGTLLFNVSGFTNYTSRGNAQLEIFDQADSQGGSLDVKVLNQINFFANYTNFTSSANISIATCDINFTDFDGVMSFNVSSELYEFNRSFASSTTFNYNVTCQATLFETLNTTDSIFISPKCLDQTPNIDINISAGALNNCTSEIIILVNQSINVYGNFILNNTVLIMDVQGSASDNINIFNNSNFTVINSTINGSSNAFIIFGYNQSFVNITDSTLFGLDIDLRNNATGIFKDSNFTVGVFLRDNTTATFVNSSFAEDTSDFNVLDDANTVFENSTLNIDLSLEDNSVNIIRKLNINKNISFFDGSYTEIKNSNISEILRLGSSTIKTAIVNFTLPQSNVTIINQIRFNSTIYGYVDLPASVTGSTPYLAIHVQRFYPVQVNFSDGNPVANRFVNVTNATNSLVFNGTTDSEGFITINITYTSGEQFNLFNVTVNPDEEVGLLSDTPVLLIILDVLAPVISNVVATPSQTSAIITWITNESANETINYSITLANFENKTIDTAFSTSHSTSLTGLLNGTLYFYNITTCDMFDNCMMNGTFNFTTTNPSASSGGSGGGGGGGGGSSSQCAELWSCAAWGECVNGVERRTCSDVNSCGSELSKPFEIRNCEVVQEIVQPIPSPTAGVITQPEPTTSSIIEPEERTAGIAGILRNIYLYIIMLILGIFLLMVFARNVDTLPWAIWRDRRYIQKGELPQAEQLYDKVIDRFGASKKKERKYVKEIEKLSLELDEAEKHTNTSEADYDEALKQYKELFRRYILMNPAEQAKIAPKMAELKKKLLMMDSKKDIKEVPYGK